MERTPFADGEMLQELWHAERPDEVLNALGSRLAAQESVRRGSRFSMSPMSASPRTLEHLGSLGHLSELDSTICSALQTQLATASMPDDEWLHDIVTIQVAGRALQVAGMRQQDGSLMLLAWEAPDSPPAVNFLVRAVRHESRWWNRLEQSEQLINRDDLTGLYNHRYLDVALEMEIKRQQRFKIPFCVLFIDIDHFKSVNDTHGHLVGSTLLKQFAAILQRELREVDSIMRYGGDEFVAVLVNSNSRSGMRVAQRLRRAIETNSFQIDGRTISLTASFGVAACPEHTVDARELVRMADESMYDSKRSGKNMVRLHSRVTDTTWSPSDGVATQG